MSESFIPLGSNPCANVAIRAVSLPKKLIKIYSRVLTENFFQLKQNFSNHFFIERIKISLLLLYLYVGSN